MEEGGCSHWSFHHVTSNSTTISSPGKATQFQTLMLVRTELLPAVGPVCFSIWKRSLWYCTPQWASNPSCHLGCKTLADLQKMRHFSFLIYVPMIMGDSRREGCKQNCPRVVGLRTGIQRFRQESQQKGSMGDWWVPHTHRCGRQVWQADTGSEASLRTCYHDGLGAISYQLPSVV